MLILPECKKAGSKINFKPPIATVTIVGMVVKNFTYNTGYFEKSLISLVRDQCWNEQAHHH